MFQAPAIPDDEDARLEALRALNILDTAPEARFDRITSLARQLFDVPIALISLVDANRQWFKSRQGLDACETPRDISFCGHAILGNDIFHIEDASKDPRFADNPLVTDAPLIRFYAGAPLRTRDGSRIGTLCLIGPKPRALSSDDRGHLRNLADLVEEELNRARLTESIALVRARESWLHALMQSVDEGILTLSQDRQILSGNRSCERMLGYQQGELPGHPISDILPEFSGRDSGETRGLRKDGSSIPLEVSSTIMHESIPPVSVITLRDISARTEVEATKRGFISLVSHELRTPLTSIRGALGLINSGKVGELTPKALELMDIASANCERLVNLINDILDIDRIERSGLPMNMKTQALLPVLRNSVALNESFAATLDVRITLDADQSTDSIKVAIDEDRIIQVMTNFLSNAAKHAPAGSVVRVGARQRNNRIRVTVTDNGQGIPGQALDSVFDKFFQVNPRDDRRKSGTGLGLSIARGIVQAHGGSVGVESVPGEYTTFWFELNIADSH